MQRNFCCLKSLSSLPYWKFPDRTIDAGENETARCHKNASPPHSFVPGHSWHWGACGRRMRAVFPALALLICLMPFCIRASIITNDNTALVFFGDSYDVYPYHYFGDYLSSWAALGHPQFTNHWSSASRSGGSLEEANEDRLERLGLAHWESGQRAIGFIMADDDGGYDLRTLRCRCRNLRR